tara:strand:- start:247 stop:465 length:219 start_codon:yes stop_codon:yes gene_type:complete
MYEKIELIISEYKLNRITKEKCLIELKNHIEQIIKLNYTHCCTELKAKLAEQLEGTKQWLIDEDFEGLAERL